MPVNRRCDDLFEISKTSIFTDVFYQNMRDCSGENDENLSNGIDNPSG